MWWPAVARAAGRETAPARKAREHVQTAVEKILAEHKNLESTIQPILGKLENP